MPTGCPCRLGLFLIFLNKADDRAYEMLALGLLGSFWYVLELVVTWDKPTN